MRTQGTAAAGGCTLDTTERPFYIPRTLIQQDSTVPQSGTTETPQAGEAERSNFAPRARVRCRVNPFTLSQQEVPANANRYQT